MCGDGRKLKGSNKCSRQNIRDGLFGFPLSTRGGWISRLLESRGENNYAAFGSRQAYTKCLIHFRASAQGKQAHFTTTMGEPPAKELGK